MGRPGVGGHSSSGRGYSGRVSGSGHTVSSRGGRGGSGSHTRPGVGSGSVGHSSSVGHTGGVGHQGTGSGHPGGNSQPGHQVPPGNNHYGHTSHHYGNSHYGNNHYGNNHYGNHYGGNHYGPGYAGTTWHGGHLGNAAPPPPPPPNYGGYGHNHYGSGYGNGYGYRRRTSRGSCIGLLVALIIIVAVIILVNKFMGSNTYQNTFNNPVSNPVVTNNNGNSQSETTPRVKLQTDSAFLQDCIEDHVGWFEDEAATEQKLMSFWEVTGVQPYVLIKEYDSSLKTVAQKEEWAEKYYKNNLTANTFLFVYFDEDNTSAAYDETVGYMYRVSSDMVETVMDEEAVQIFWDYLDYYWMLEYLTTDDVITMSFDSTASVIMNEPSLDPGVALAQAQAQAAQQEAMAAQAQAEAAQAQAIAAQAEAEAARAEAAAQRMKVIRTVITVLLIIVGVVILVLGGLAVFSVVIYSRSQRKEAEEKQLSTPVSKEEAEGAIPNSTSNSVNSHPLNEKSSTGMSASTRGVNAEASTGDVNKSEQQGS